MHWDKFLFIDNDNKFLTSEPNIYLKICIQVTLTGICVIPEKHITLLFAFPQMLSELILVFSALLVLLMLPNEYQGL